MASSLSLDASEQDLTFKLVEALMSSLDLSEMLKRAYGVISPVLAADYAAICISKPGRPTEYEWVVAEMPDAYFVHYAEMAQEDFVRHSVVKQPNVVLRDTEMVSREQLERSLLYQRSHELGMPLEHVMAVMLQVDQDWHGGFMLYRDKPKPFSDKERALLQGVAPLLALSVRNCREMGTVQRERWEAQQGRWMLEQILSTSGTESLVLAEPATEMMRTAGATKLLEEWFASDEFDGKLPAPLVEHLGKLAGSAMRVEQDIWEREREGGTLRVTFKLLRGPANRRMWVLMLQVIPDGIPVPHAWRVRLTKREVEVVDRLLRGWDYETIAEDLDCKKATVTKHLQHIYDKLGVANAKKLQSLAPRR